MKRLSLKWLLILVAFVCVCSSLSAQSADSALVRYALQGPARIVISVEKGWQRDGVIPVCVMVNGIESTLFMTPDGQVSADRSNYPTARGLFQLNATNGELAAGAWQRSGQIYEQNDLRTRIRLNVENVELLLSADGRQAALNLAGLEIPLRASLVKQPDGSEELSLGDRPRHGFERLLLDMVTGTIIHETALPGSANGQSQHTRACWAIGKIGENK
jgi:hypothetical protein